MHVNIPSVRDACGLTSEPPPGTSEAFPREASGSMAAQLAQGSRTRPELPRQPDSLGVDVSAE
jgi:hypothetical protein